MLLRVTKYHNCSKPSAYGNIRQSSYIIEHDFNHMLSVYNCVAKEDVMKLDKPIQKHNKPGASQRWTPWSS